MNRRALACLCLALSGLSCVASRPPLRVLPDDGRLVIRFAPRAAGPYYDVASLRARVDALDPTAFSVTLRPDAVARFVTDLAPATCVSLVLTDAGAARLRAQASAAVSVGRSAGRLSDDLDRAIFVVELDGRRLFEGQTWPAMGAAAFDTPAMHPADVPAPARLLINASQGMWTRLGPGGRSPIDHEALRGYFRSRGALEERRRCADP